MNHIGPRQTAIHKRLRFVKVFRVVGPSDHSVCEPDLKPTTSPRFLYLQNPTESRLGAYMRDENNTFEEKSSVLTIFPLV